MDWKTKLQLPTRLRLWQHILIFLLAYFVIVLRRPDALLHPQFCVEDGHVFFADAYNYGWWRSLFGVYQGYLHTVPRLAASLALLAPLSLAPLVTNLAAIVVEALPASILLSSRSSAWGSLRFRALLACSYLLLPNTRELSNGITHTQWHLALCTFLLLAASAPTGRVGRLFEGSILLLCGLTGPFCFFLLLIALSIGWKRRERWQWIKAGILAGTCIIQGCVLQSGGFSARPHSILGASPELFARILAGHIYVASVLGGNLLAISTSSEMLIFSLVVIFAGTAIIAICFFNSALEMKLFVVFAFVVFAASIMAPAAYPPAGESIWRMLAGAVGIRYWYYPTLAFVWSILWCLRNRHRSIRFVAAGLLILSCIGMIRDWSRPKYEDMHFADEVKSFEALPAGEARTIPENPKGWTIRLVRHASDR